MNTNSQLIGLDLLSMNVMMMIMLLIMTMMMMMEEMVGWGGSSMLCIQTGTALDWTRGIRGT